MKCIQDGNASKQENREKIVLYEREKKKERKCAQKSGEKKIAFASLRKKAETK
jgi:hypothetical protein